MFHEYQTKCPDELTDISTNISRFLLRTGIRPNLYGYIYLRQGILIGLQDTSVMTSITKKLYPSIAASCQTTPVKVERGIRNAIQGLWEKGDRTFFRNATCYPWDRRPTNGEFVSYMVEYFRKFY